MLRYINEKEILLREEDKLFFNRNGFLAVEGVFEKDECDVITSQVRFHANSDFAALVNIDRMKVLAKQDLRAKSDDVIILHAS